MPTCSTTGCCRKSSHGDLVRVAHVVDDDVLTRVCCRPCARQFLAGSGTTGADLWPLDADVDALRDRLLSARSDGGIVVE